MYYVYALFNRENSKIYIGQTESLKVRVGLHNNKIFENSYTSRFSGRWELIYKEELLSRKEALRREKQLKSYRGREFVKKYIPR
ncbi:MAG: GIY-YIG nuclease family protein [Patescibacteria group bacterium]